MEDWLIEVNRDLKTLVVLCGTKNTNDLWSKRVQSWLRKLVNSDGTLRTEVVSNFRRREVFVAEMPNHARLTPKALINGGHRGSWKYMKERLEVVIQEGDADLLEKHPISPAGNPIVAEIGGFRYNKRWLNNIRYLSLANRYLKTYLEKQGSALLDIGGAFGAFLYLLKREYPGLKLGIVEFPEQFLLTRYFLKSQWPELRINSLQEVIEVDEIGEEFLERFDVVFIPVECYEKIKSETFGVVSNFFSLGEMSEEWFHRYVSGEAITGTSYLMTINRFQSAPSYDTSLTILDYELHDYEKLHFKISNYEQYYYRRKQLFFMEQEYYTSQFFEFVGERLKK